MGQWVVAANDSIPAYRYLVYATINQRTEGWENELDRIFSEHATTLARLVEVFNRIIAWIEKHPGLN